MKIIMRYPFFILIIFLLSNCSSSIYEDRIEILELYKDSLGNGIDRDSIHIYNKDKSIYCTIIPIDGEPTCNMLDGNVISYYPYPGIIVMLCRSYDDKYLEVRIGNEWKLLDVSTPHKCSSIQEYFGRYNIFYLPEKTHAIYKNKIKGKKTEFAANQLFVIIQAKDDWLEIMPIKDNDEAGKIEYIGNSRYWTQWKDGLNVFKNNFLYE